MKKFTFGIETDTRYQVVWTATLVVQVHTPEEFIFCYVTQVELTHMNILSKEK